jgi:GTP cyclohydrolase I
MKVLDKRAIKMLWIDILDLIGEDVGREGLLGTPERVANMYADVFSGYWEDPPPITMFKNNRPGGLILDKGYFYSFCEHHVLPFFGDYYFGYIPDKQHMGASKIGRTVNHYCSKLQMAENLCFEVLERIEKVVEPLGSILLMSGRHFCKEMRGLRMHDSPFEVIEARGILLSNKDGCKDEFMARIGSRI